MRIFLLFISLFFLSTEIIAQENNTVKGKILDSATDKPMDNVNIVNLNQVSGTTTNSKGEFEIQAKKKGGFVHILLGNHEYMVFQNDLRYIHSKYHKTPFLLGIEYKELYGKNTVIGKWLR